MSCLAKEEEKMIPKREEILELSKLPTEDILSRLQPMSHKDRVGTLTELLVVGTRNEWWASREDIKRQLWKQVAPIMHKYDIEFLIRAFVECPSILVKDGKPSMWAWTTMRWRDECARCQGEHAERMKQPVLTDDDLASLEVLVGR